MASSKTAPKPIMASQISMLHGALVDIVSVMNRPQRDEMMAREAGISLDRALFPLLLGIARCGPIGVVDLADQVGRDYTTVSRQVAKLAALGLIMRQANPADRRIMQAIVTPAGLAMTDAVDAARERLGQATFASWEGYDFEELIRLVRKFADALNETPLRKERTQSAHRLALVTVADKL